MRPLRLELSGFLSYAEPTSIDFADVEAVAVVGDNGAGKTALLEAISWALYGITRARGADEVVNDSSTSARVAFEFALGREEFRVVRERHSGKSGKSELRLEHTQHVDARDLSAIWDPVGGDKIADTQAAIEELLGMSADLFVSTAFVGQGDADRFTELRPAARKALLFELLEFGHYEALAAAAHREGQIHDSAIGKLEGRREALSDGLEDPDELQARRDGAAEAVESMRADRDECRANVAAARSTLEDARRHVAGTERTRETLEAMRGARLARLEEVTTRIDGLDSRLDELNAEGRQADAGIAAESAHAARYAEVEARATETEKDAQGRRTAAEQALREHEEVRILLGRREERLALLEDREIGGETCPTCGQPITAELRHGLDRDLADARAGVDTARAVLETTAAALERTQTDLRHTQDELAAATEEVAEIRRAIAELDVWRRRRAMVTESVEQIIADLKASRHETETLVGPTAEETKLAEELGAAVEIAGRIDGLAAALNDLESRERRLDDDLNIAAEGLARTDERLETARKRHDELAVVAAELVDLGAQRRRFSILEGAFGRDGIPAELLRRSTSELERETNEILGKLTAGRYSLAIETERALRSGRAAETLDVIVSDDRADRPLEALSGGERQAVDIALRLGLSRILAARAGHPVELLVLDETFAAFDSARRQAAVELLGAVRDRFGCVVFVTHDRALAEAFPRRLFVERVGETSRARLE